MEPRIGQALRAARKRREVELSEVESSTRIRRHYLRAIEDEEWELLPGGPYSRAFIRTYATFLGLDGERLAEDYRRQAGEPAAAEVAPAPEGVERSRRSAGAPRLSPPALGAIVSAALIVALVALGLATREGGDSSLGPGPVGGDRGAVQAPAEPPPPRPGISVRLRARAEVWVCLLDAGGRPLVDGQVLVAGAREGPFRSGSFTVSFGNGEVSMAIDGQRASIPATSSPIGYAIEPGGRLRALDEARRPTCT